MRTIHYAGAELTTGTEIATAVLNFCAALADDATAETIEIPIVANDGSHKAALLVLGPASQIVAVDADCAFEEVEDRDVVDLLNRRTAAHRPISTTPRDRVDQHSHEFAWAQDI